MCGIIGYIGEKQAQPILLNGLKRLEYRGYDCLSPDTLVQLRNGSIKTIQEIEPEAFVSSVNLQNFSSTQAKVDSKGIREKRLVYKIRTSTFEIESSRDHRFFVYEDGSVVEKRASDLKPGDFLMASRRIDIKGHLQKLPRIKDTIYYQLTKKGVKIIQKIREGKNFSYNFIERKTGIHHQYVKDYLEGKRGTQRENWDKLFGLLKIDYSSLKKFCKQKICSHSFKNFFKISYLDPVLSQIIGYILGDGSRINSQRDTKIKIEDDFQALKIYRDLFKKIGIDIKLLKHRHKNCWQIHVYSAAFGKLLNKIAPKVLSDSSEREIPEIVQKSPLSCVASFLRGLFDAEGCVGKRRGDGVSIFSANKKLLIQIQLLLLRFGIVSIPSKEYNRISIRDYDDLNKFSKHIGFSNPRKKKRLKDLLILKKGSKNGGLTALTPLTYKDLREKLDLRCTHPKSFVSVYVLKKNQKRIKDKEFSNFIKKYFLNPSIFWVKVKSIERFSSKHLMYDLSVSSTQNFIANGLIVHNSAGMVVYLPHKNSLSVRKLPGKVKGLELLLKKKPLSGFTGIAHTRWSTHGVPNQVNAHPHLDCKGQIAVVHNGTIENYAELKEELKREGHRFRSQTDTEVIVHLIEKFYKNSSLEEATRKAVKKLKGSFAIGVISEKEPNKLIGARFQSPLIVGLGEKENFLASDIPALLDYTKKVILLEENEIVVLEKEKIRITDFEGKIIKREPIQITWTTEEAQKGGYKHFMLKEIYEQPKVLERIFSQRIKNNKIFFEELKISDEELLKIKNISITACGTAYHAGFVGKYIIEKICRIPVEVSLSSEFRYQDPILDKDTLVIAISQSGETADTIAAVREAKKKGAKILSICNVLGSTLTRESDGVIYTHAGPEIGVASTKTYTAQLAILYLFSFYLANLKGLKDEREISRYLESLKKIPKKQQDILKNSNYICCIARRHSHFGSFLYLGRNINYPSALEGALKLKEISYIPAEGYAAGEMKHGPIALIDEYRAVVCIITESPLYEKMLSNIQEILSRKGRVICISTEGDSLIKNYIKEIIYIPKIDEIFSPLLVAIPLQLLAYYIAEKRGCEIDQPRNLAKSVTVE